MLNFTIKRTGYLKHCVLTGPMGSIVSIEFTNRTDAALFAQQKADGYKAMLWFVNERGGSVGGRRIPPPEGMEPRDEPPEYLFPRFRATPQIPVPQVQEGSNKRMPPSPHLPMRKESERPPRMNS